MASGMKRDPKTIKGDTRIGDWEEWTKKKAQGHQAAPNAGKKMNYSQEEKSLGGEKKKSGGYVKRSKKKEKGLFYWAGWHEQNVNGRQKKTAEAFGSPARSGQRREMKKKREKRGFGHEKWQAKRHTNESNIKYVCQKAVTKPRGGEREKTHR